MFSAKENAMFVVSLDIDPMGQATERIPDLEKSAQLHNTLLQGLFPDIRVARLNVPGGGPPAPEIPTVDEAGLPGFYISNWYALFAPKGTPKNVIDPDSRLPDRRPRC
jgi:hypothetical protein